MKRKLLSLLVLLCGVAMSVWAQQQQEEVLTVITPSNDVDDLTPQYSVAGRAVLTMDGNVMNGGAEYGWITLNNGSLTVEAVSGYKVTRITFELEYPYDTFVNPIEINQAPFTIYLYTYYYNSNKYYGTYSETDGYGTYFGEYGPQKITVYGYADNGSSQTSTTETIATNVVGEDTFTGTNVCVTSDEPCDRSDFGVYVCAEDNSGMTYGMTISTTNGSNISSIVLTLGTNWGDAEYVLASAGDEPVVTNEGETVTITGINTTSVTITTALPTEQNPYIAVFIKEVKVTYVEEQEEQPQPILPTETTVTWDADIISEIGLYYKDDYYTNQGITAAICESRDKQFYGSSIRSTGSSGYLKFSCNEGYISKIEITATSENTKVSNPSDGWSSLSGAGTLTWNGKQCGYVDLDAENLSIVDISQIVFTIRSYDITLTEEADNSEILEDYDQLNANVTLKRTLQTGGWNTFSVPFNIWDNDTEDGITFTGTPLEGATVKKLIYSFFNGTEVVELLFEDVYEIEAGKPYLVKVPAKVENPMFENAYIDNTTTNVSTNYADFVPVINPTELTGGNKSALILINGNTLTYPLNDVNIYGFRAYFLLHDYPSEVKGYRMNLGDETVTGIISINSDITDAAQQTGIYTTLDGRRLQGKPTQRGLYIVNGKKVFIK